jgi:hypothetical protein
VTRKVGQIVPVVQFAGGEYSVPDDYAGQEVWVRQQDDEIVIVHLDSASSSPHASRPGNGVPAATSPVSSANQPGRAA